MHGRLLLLPLLSKQRVWPPKLRIDPDSYVAFCFCNPHLPSFPHPCSALLPILTPAQGDCSTSSPYFDYPGALRCLMEGAGDVAFVKAETPVDYASDGPSRQPWSALPASELRLLCPTGGCRPVNQPGGCSIAAVPSRAVMVRSGYADAAAVRSALVNLHTDAAFKNLVFNQASNPKWVLDTRHAICKLCSQPVSLTCQS